MCIFRLQHRKAVCTDGFPSYFSWSSAKPLSSRFCCVPLLHIFFRILHNNVLQASQPATVNAATDHMEIFWCGGAAGTGGKERSWRSSVTENGEKTFKRPTGSLKNCVQWWGEPCVPTQRSAATGDATGNRSVWGKTVKTSIFWRHCFHVPRMLP